MKKGLIINLSVILILICSGILLFEIWGYQKENKDVNIFSTNEKEILIKEENIWKPFEIKGVNMGSGYPGEFPKEDGISEDTYFRWMKMIGNMNANTIRVYKLQSPGFYNALKRYNEQAEKKLYLIQTLEFPEEHIFSDEDVFEEENMEAIYELSEDTIDALHGRKFKYHSENDSLNIYKTDVSEYVLGYILGLEWDDVYIKYICEKNADKQTFMGDYLYCRYNATPFENFLTRWGNHVLGYEERNYEDQKLLSFANWAETDPFLNEIEINNFKKEETVIDIERIKTTDKVKTGIFASYNIYPYYPLFLQLGEYTKYVDDEQHNNPYRKYLMTLVEHHKYPVVISEYGVPSSRSITHLEQWRKFTHGGLNEEEQANAVKSLYTDIKKAGCAGSMVFSWQDEWFKRTWNEMLLSDADRRAYWSNAESAEQAFGILAFDPGKEKTTCILDENKDEWKKSDHVLKYKDLDLYMKSDERYVYFMVDGLKRKKGENLLNIALDVTPKTGRSSLGDKKSSRDIDFVIQIVDRNQGAIYVDEEYDTIVYSKLGVIKDYNMQQIRKLETHYKNMESPLPEDYNFNIISKATDRTYKILYGKETVHDIGRLVHGKTDPNKAGYDSNADYYINDEFVEIRIPWHLLNFVDPSKSMIVDELHKHDFDIEKLEIDNIHAALYEKEDTEIKQFGSYHLKQWDKPKWHERLKKVYYVLQETFKEVKINDNREF